MENLVYHGGRSPSNPVTSKRVSLSQLCVRVCVCASVRATKFSQSAARLKLCVCACKADFSVGGETPVSALFGVPPSLRQHVRTSRSSRPHPPVRHLDPSSTPPPGQSPVWVGLGASGPPCGPASCVLVRAGGGGGNPAGCDARMSACRCRKKGMCRTAH